MAPGDAECTVGDLTSGTSRASSEHERNDDHREPCRRAEPRLGRRGADRAALRARRRGRRDAGCPARGRLRPAGGLLRRRAHELRPATAAGRHGVSTRGVGGALRDPLRRDHRLRRARPAGRAAGRRTGRGVGQRPQPRGDRRPVSPRHRRERDADGLRRRPGAQARAARARGAHGALVSRAVTLLGADRRPYRSAVPGTLGGHRRTRVFGRLDCPGALSWLAKGHYARHRVFFADAAAALSAGFRPCSRCRPDATVTPPVTLTLTPRDPFDARHLLAYLAARTVAGIDGVGADGTYRHGALAVRIGEDRVEVVVDDGATAAQLPAVVARVRALVDADARPATVARALGRDALLAPLVAARPGLRAPGTLDGAHLALRAVVHQQVSLSGARTVLARLPATVPDLASADPAMLPLPRARARALVGLATALADGTVDLRPGADPAAARAALHELPGIGPWTVEYIALRALGDRDPFPASDLGLRRASGLRERELAARAERWRPLRAYAAHHLWAAA